MFLFPFVVGKLKTYSFILIYIKMEWLVTVPQSKDTGPIKLKFGKHIIKNSGSNISIHLSLNATRHLKVM